VAYANYLCDEWGLDTISAAVVAAWAMECLEKGLLSAGQIGREVSFGDLASVEYLLELMATRQGLGEKLAEGVKPASQWLGQGSEDFAIQVKGLEWTGYETRNAPGMMLSYMTADIGAHHNRSWALGNDVAGATVDVHSLVAAGGEAQPLGKSPVGGQSEAVINLQHLRPAFDLLGVCRLQFMELGIEVEHYEELFELVTGRKLSWEQLLEVSQRVWHLTRAISLRELGGIERQWDYPPARFMTEPVPTGPNQGHLISRDEVEQLLDEYYAARGWDERGRPTRATLEAQGLADVAEELGGLIR
jgi:aldehyde:ferredoxin oxidoreductase